MNSKPSDKVTRASYDQIALDYLDRHRNRTGYFKDFKTFSSLLKAPAIVLDIGSGPGIEAAQLKKIGFEVVCVDLSLSMLTVGAAEYPALRVQADMRSLPISQVVGGIWAAASLHHLERQHVPNTLKEFSNTLVAGGILYLCVKQG
ncbi:MAG: class I SAM-dependent methyltransferase, partial [Gammaproteobacteria bacterium]|nr:class I SAM-dependent methyltransferase [Gammaproteobacteria bacterium]